VRPWIYAREIETGALVFEAVQAALKASHRHLILATPLSIASAWTQTEMAGPGLKTIVFDGNNPALMELLETWDTPCKADQPCFDLALLSELQREYAHHYSERRVAKYKKSATNFLIEATAQEFAVYPRRPTHWKGHELFIDFDSIIRTHLDDWNSGAAR
jgi:hypothetical protein